MRLRLLISVVLVLLGCGCQPLMNDQPRHEAYEASEFFADGMSARLPVEGAVPRTSPRALAPGAGERLETNPFRDEAALNQPPFMNNPELYVDRIPLPLTLEVVERGQERYGIFCASCHGHAGNGDGIIVRHGYPPAASFHTPRLRDAPVGYLFDVVSRGQGKMPAYANHIPATDRWAIVGYLRALQLSEHAALESLPEAVQDRFAQ